MFYVVEENTILNRQTKFILGNICSGYVYAVTRGNDSSVARFASYEDSHGVPANRRWKKGVVLQS